ncbi:MAG TPA: helix-turn-helix transcriptional regulator [Victivallales bacterium]|nr:helix-turn-helix transcriptional regulator [Victivallales bacterium]
MKLYIDKINEIRKSKHITVNSIAEYMGRTRNTITNWLHERSIPSRAEIIALAHMLETSVSEISDLNDRCKSGKNVNNTQKIVSAVFLLEKIIEEFGDVPAVSVGPLKILNDNIKNILNENQRNRELAAKYLTLIDALDLIVYVKNKNRVIQRINSSFLNYCSQNDDIVGNKFIDLFGREEIEEIVNLENKVFNSGNYIKDRKIKIPGAKNKLGVLSISPVFNSKNEVSEIVSCIKDISFIHCYPNKAQFI